ncbi:hypothetical protein PgNI_10440 [Pyricularia grisea]|uniref:Uncharacterized protein n=1 Tax=Pyricularia grisea TaxID=148305 RepID=A0A6P8AY90_PYRGI|nr:hypothetical protein PgNI_10440 [Pyricularia grisea]TLD07305.1 hypothetical protein PgNI_10440 [Pyricularia grisea]
MSSSASNVPKAVFPPKGTTYQTADEWYTVLADMQIASMLFQHNDMVSSEDDCKTKYVARQLFRRLAKGGRLSSFGFAEDDWSAGQQDAETTRLPMPHRGSPFPIWPDNFRPANVMFVLDPPWWLLLDVPEMWDDGIDDWTSVYDRRVQTWFAAMEEAEKDTDEQSKHKTTSATIESRHPLLPLSAYMRESWATGRFWLNYAARKSWAFDAIYWKYLDQNFFGKRDENIPMHELWKTRVHLLNQERGAMDMVQIKMEESKERVLVEWDDASARQRLAHFLFE